MHTGAASGPRLAAGRARRSVLAGVLLGAALLGIAIGLVIGLTERSAPARRAAAGVAAPLRYGLHGEATWAPGAVPAPPLRALRDQDGKPFSLAEIGGRTAVIAFFDSYCHQACPLEGRALDAAERALPAAQRPVLVVVSVNPRDTPASTRAAVRAWGLAAVAPWHWLRGSRAELARAWKAYRILVAPPANGDIAHTEALYLIGRRGDERSAYLYPFMPRFVTADLRVLARERKG